METSNEQIRFAGQRHSRSRTERWHTLTVEETLERRNAGKQPDAHRNRPPPGEYRSNELIDRRQASGSFVEQLTIMVVITIIAASFQRWATIKTPSRFHFVLSAVTGVTREYRAEKRWPP